MSWYAALLKIIQHPDCPFPNYLDRVQCPCPNLAQPVSLEYKAQVPEDFVKRSIVRSWCFKSKLEIKTAVSEIDINNMPSETPEMDKKHIMCVGLSSPLKKPDRE